jgi:hypothetical protein
MRADPRRVIAGRSALDALITLASAFGLPIDRLQLCARVLAFSLCFEAGKAAFQRKQSGAGGVWAVFETVDDQNLTEVKAL